MAVEFGLLGTIEARVDGRLVDVGHIRQRSVLAALLTDATRTVPVDELVDRVWGDRVPQRGKETLYGYMSRLRRALRPAGEVRIVRRPGATSWRWIRRPWTCTGSGAWSRRPGRPATSRRRR